MSGKKKTESKATKYKEKKEEGDLIHMHETNIKNNDISIIASFISASQCSNDVIDDSIIFYNEQ